MIDDDSHKERSAGAATTKDSNIRDQVLCLTPRQVVRHLLKRERIGVSCLGPRFSFSPSRILDPLNTELRLSNVFIAEYSCLN